MAAKPRPYPQTVLDLLAEKSEILSKAQAFAAMEMPQTALPLWLSAAALEERLAPILETIGRDNEAAVHRISAASCYSKAGEPGRAVNLFRAALAGPLPSNTQSEVHGLLAACLKEVNRDTQPRRRRKVAGRVDASPVH